MLLAWVFSKSKPTNIHIVDKTVLTRIGQEHVSLNWILNKEKYTKADGSLYSITEDYHGFFPKEDKKYVIDGMEKFTPQELNKLAEVTDIAYYADTYGIYKNEWFNQSESLERSGILYGGMSEQDIQYLTALKKRKKLIIAEFNDIASPTTPKVREKFENLFDVKWTGWIGRFFEVLDTTKANELPNWLTKNYKKQHNNQWPFVRGGIVLVHESDQIEILESGVHLKKDLPIIHTSPRYQEQYSLADEVKYSYWFDILKTKRTNDVISTYTLETTSKGDSILTQNNILKTFPAVIAHNKADYKFYYFAGDFADNSVSRWSAYFKGISPVARTVRTFYISDYRGSFFWDFYEPLMTKILNDNEQSKQ